MSHTTHIVDASGPVAYSTGTGLTLLSWLNTWDWGFLIGVLIGLAGLFISYQNHRTNKQFQKRKDKREQEEHELKVAKLRGECNDKD